MQNRLKSIVQPDVSEIKYLNVYIVDELYHTLHMWYRPTGSDKTNYNKLRMFAD